MKPSTLAESQFACKRTVSTDPHDFNTLIKPGWSQRIYQLSPGPFRFSYTTVTLQNGCYVEFAQAVGGARLESASLENFHIGFISGEELRVLGIKADEALVTVTPPGCGWEASGKTGGAGYSLNLMGDTLRIRLGESAYSRSMEALRRSCGGGTLIRRLGGGPPTRLRRLLVELLTEAAGNDGIAATFQLRQVEWELFEHVHELIPLIIPDPGETGPPPLTRRATLAREAEHLLWQNAYVDKSTVPYSLEDLAGRVGVSPRTLQLALQEYFGYSFREMSISIRLHSARARILAAETTDRENIAGIAFSCGFWHLGRFAVYYKRLFGCRPSQDIQRVRSQRTLENRTFLAFSKLPGTHHSN